MTTSNVATETLLVDETLLGSRIDLALKNKFPEYSRTYFQFLLEKQAILVNHHPIKKREHLRLGDLLNITFLLKEDMSLEPETIPLDVLYEDEEILVINKPRHLVVHPAPGHPQHTLVNALMGYFRDCSAFKDPLRPGIVHRLDKDTSGVILIAKDPQTHEILSKAFSDRLVQKTYVAVCYGLPKATYIEGKIARDLKHRQKMKVQEEGRLAITSLEILQSYQGFSFLKLMPLTGRTHQLRVHLAALGAPILGDPLYGIGAINEKYGYSEQLLHAHQLKIVHPKTKKELLFEAPLPSDILNALDQLQLKD